jgi:hypothetical protein
MDKQQMVEKATETLRPFETQNLMDTIQNMTLNQIFTHPIMLVTVFGCLFYGVYKRSTPVLLTLFFLISMIVVVRYLMPIPGQELTMTAILPFVTGGLVIGGIIIYFSMIKS